YFDARLTTVATQTAGATPPTGSGTTSTLDSFAQSQKAASLQVGTYLPITTGEWQRSKEWYSFFVAPLAKAGFTTLTDTQTASTSATTPGVSSTATAQPLTDRFFTSYAYG